MTIRQDYLEYIIAASENTAEYLERSIKSWRESFDPHNTLFGYAGSGAPAAAAAVDTFMYQVTGDRRYAKQAREALLMPRELTSIYPPDIAAGHPEYHRAVPPIGHSFVAPNYIAAYERIRASGVLSSADHLAIESIVADSLHPVFHFPEWGAHNRAMLRALSLALAARAFPSNPEAKDWLQLADQNAAASWGRWSVEDALGYHAVWLLALYTYAEVRSRPGLFDLPATYYYAHYFARMLTPLDTFPDFGDCNWGGGGERFLPCFEKAATVYRIPEFKYVAERLFHRMVNKGPPSIGGALLCIQAYEWADDTVPVTRPTWGSGEVQDDLIGKKVVFRSGWDPKATYMMLNYRDEGDYGLIPRNYLRTTLAVSAEKMHHGHADENAIVLLLSKGAALLHDGGYRDNVPNGRYRADIYHNRVIWRQGIKRPDVAAWDFFHDDGSYKIVRTQKLHFDRFRGVEFSRTRVTDVRRGIEWDRIITYLTDLDCFVLFDAVRALEAGPFALANILYTTDILASGSGHTSSTRYFDTRIDEISGWQNPDHRALLIAYLTTENRPLSAEQTRRHYRQETGLFQTWTGHLRAGDVVPFVTVLWPHARDQEIAPLANALSLLQVSHQDRSVGLQIKLDGRTVTLGLKLDLEIGLLRQDIRPRYTYEAGSIRCGKWETDATLFFADQQSTGMHVAFAEGSRLCYNGEPLYAGESLRVFQEDASNDVISTTWRERWERTIP